MDIMRYIDELEERERERVEREAQAEAEREAQAEKRRLAEWALSYAAIEPLTPEILRPFMVHEADGNLGYSNNVFFDVPGLAPIVICFVRDNGGWKMSTERSAITVKTYELKVPYAFGERSDYCVQFDRWIDAGSIDAALMMARASESNRIALEEQAEQANQRLKEQAEREAQYKAEQASAYEQQQARQQAEQAERRAEIDAVVKIVETDPVARAMVAVWQALTDERREWQESVEAMQNGAESTEAFYERRLREVRVALEYERQNAEEEQRRAGDLENEISALKKKQKRGW